MEVEDSALSLSFSSTTYAASFLLITSQSLHQNHKTTTVFHLRRITTTKILSLFLFFCLLPSLSRCRLPSSAAATIFFPSLQPCTVGLWLSSSPKPPLFPDGIGWNQYQLCNKDFVLIDKSNAVCDFAIKDIGARHDMCDPIFTIGQGRQCNLWLKDPTVGNILYKLSNIEVAEARKQASIIESYLEQRGVDFLEGYISYKVVLPNPKLCHYERKFSASLYTFNGIYDAECLKLKFQSENIKSKTKFSDQISKLRKVCSKNKNEVNNGEEEIFYFGDEILPLFET
ncbi:hypothetical protein S245_030670, partial [Arachis hypogaea]